MRRRLRYGSCAAMIAIATAACGAGENPTTGAWQAVHDTIGDTIVVRTVAGNVWQGEAELVPEVTIGTMDGEDEYMFGSVQSLAVDEEGAIYVYDGRVKALRKYDADGRFVATFGREGEGPGEYRNPDGGLGILPDGRIVLRDPGNARLQFYTSEGEPAGSWPMPGGFSTSSQLVVGADGGMFTNVIAEPMTADMTWRLGMVRYEPDGQVGDTLVEPVWGELPGELVARTERTMSRRPVPFGPTAVTVFSPSGHYLGGISDRYAFHIPRPDGTVLRIERAANPVPVHPEERDRAERQTIRAMRSVQPDWRWNGPSIPSVKPAYRTIQIAEDGRYWVAVSQPSERIPDDEVEETDDDLPPLRWREPIAYDVFEADGRYLGRVRAPTGFMPYPQPVFRDEYVWAVVRGEFDVPFVTRFRIER